MNVAGNATLIGWIACVLATVQGAVSAADVMEHVCEPAPQPASTPIVSAAQAPNAVSSSQVGFVSGGRLNTTPDLMQAAAGLPWGGQAHCGPVAASNSLIWFARNGYYRVVEGDPQVPQTQHRLALKLGNYMGTSLKDGTSVTAFVSGISDYLSDRGFRGTISCKGWEDCPRRFYAGKYPDLNFMKEGLKDAAAAWAKIGWYKYNSQTNTYTRFAGHWVTLVDAGRGKNGLACANCVVIHDPAPRSGESFVSEYTTLSTLKSGRIITGYGKPITGAGMLKMGGELKIKDKADCGLIDDVVLLTQLSSM